MTESLTSSQLAELVIALQSHGPIAREYAVLMRQAADAIESLAEGHAALVEELSECRQHAEDMAASASAAAVRVKELEFLIDYVEDKDPGLLNRAQDARSLSGSAKT